MRDPKPGRGRNERARPVPFCLSPAFRYLKNYVEEAILSVKRGEES